MSWHVHLPPEAPARRPRQQITQMPPPGPRVGVGVPAPGSVLYLGRAASVQFTEPIMFRLVRALDFATHDGWIWLEGYELDSRGDAIEKRQIFVQMRGLRVLHNRR